MTRAELGIQTPKSFHNKVKGFFDLEREKFESEEVLIRRQTGLLMNSTGNYGKQGLNIQKVWPIPMDALRIEAQKVSQKEMKAVVDKYSKMFDK